MGEWLDRYKAHLLAILVLTIAAGTALVWLRGPQPAPLPGPQDASASAPLGHTLSGPPTASAQQRPHHASGLMRDPRGCTMGGRA